jgi:hypothetical protein
LLKERSERVPKITKVLQTCYKSVTKVLPAPKSRPRPDTGVLQGGEGGGGDDDRASMRVCVEMCMCMYVCVCVCVSVCVCVCPRRALRGLGVRA